MAGVAGGGPWLATGIAAAVLCLGLIVKVSDAATQDPGWAGQVPWVAALFVLPLLYVFPGPRRFLARHRWPVLGVQAVLTWVPFAVFGGRWVIGIGGLLAGLVLLTLPGRVAWPAAGLLLAADVAVRATVAGLPYQAGASGALLEVVAFVVDAVLLFGMVRLVQIVGEVQDAHRQAADLAVARERLRAAESLQAAVGERLAGIAARAAAAGGVLAADATRAREQIAAAGVAAREAIAQARAVTADRRDPDQPEPGAAPAGWAVIGGRLAWAVLVVEVFAVAVQGLNNAWFERDGPRLGALVVTGIVALVALQLYHSRAAGQGGRPRAWPVTLGLQAVLAYGFFLPFLAADISAPAVFLPGSVLLLVPGLWRWAGFAAVIISYSALLVAVPLHGILPIPWPGWSLNVGVEMAIFGLLVYGLSRLAGLARELEGLRGELTRTAAVRERLRVARDVHDLLGLGLSAIALKADLAGALIGRDDTRAGAEMDELRRICAAARADIRQVTGQGARLSLAGELAAAEQILAAAGVVADTDIPAGPLPAAADEVLAPVLREAVTNILRHATATACTIKVTICDGTLRLGISNDGVTEPPASPSVAGGRGLPNMDARVQAAGGQLATRRAGRRFDLTAEIPLGDHRLTRAG